MAFICKRTEKCDTCRCFRADEDDQMVCWAAQDGKNISKIIVDVWDLNQAEFAKYKDQMKDFNLWVSFIMCYGYDPAGIIEYAKIRGIEWDPNDCDPDDKDDHYGALKLNAEVVAEIKEELYGTPSI